MRQEPTFNQYAPPKTDVMDPVSGAAEAAELRLFSPEGRIGRLRYLAYVIGGGWLIKLLSGVLIAMTIAVAPGVAAFIPVIAWAPILWFAIITGIKRAHDFNASGWWSVVSLIPLVGVLVWSLIPGSEGGNRYGPPPPANTWGVRLLALVVPIVIVGILAAVAIPAYKDYTDRARAAQSVAPR